MPDIYRIAEQELLTISSTFDTDNSFRVFLLGPYVPENCKAIMTYCSDRLRNKYHITSFLETDINIDYAIHDIFTVLYQLSQLSVFIIPNHFRSFGWLQELTTLLGTDDSINRLSVYYESFDSLPGTIRDLLIDTKVRHGPMVISSNLEKTAKTIGNHINSYFFGFD